MIERKIRAGMELNFPLPTFKDYPAADNYLQPVPTLYCHVARHGDAKHRTRNLGEGHLVDGVLRRQAHRNFTWLPYRPGFTTYTTLGNCDVLSGDFSGCRMVMCEIAGERRVFHVGTFDNQQSEASLRAKRAMYRVLTDDATTYITGFSPFSNYDPIGFNIGMKRSWVLGLITETAECFSILMLSALSTQRALIADKEVIAVQPGQTMTRAEALAFFNV